MQHARTNARRRTTREPDPVVRRVDAGTLALGFVCFWIYVGMLVVDGERMAGLLTLPFVVIMLAILAVRIVWLRVLRRRARPTRARH